MALKVEGSESNIKKKNVMHSICHVTSQEHITEGSCDFVGGKSLQYVTALISFVTIGITIVEIQCF